MYWNAKLKGFETKKNVKRLVSALHYKVGWFLDDLFMREVQVRCQAAASLAALAKNDSQQDETIIKALGDVLLIETARPTVYEQIIKSLSEIGKPYAINTLISNGIGNKQMVKYFYNSKDDPIYKALDLNDNFVYLFTDTYDGDQNFRYFLSEYKSKFIKKVTPEKQNEVKIDGLINKGLYKIAFTVAHSESPQMVNFLANKLLIVINDKDLKSSNKMAAIIALREIKETGMIVDQNLLYKIIDVVEH